LSPTLRIPHLRFAVFDTIVMKHDPGPSGEPGHGPPPSRAMSSHDRR
jgi:hypothetical protein